jgi:hypothetical protein
MISRVVAIAVQAVLGRVMLHVPGAQRTIMRSDRWRWSIELADAVVGVET